MQYGYSSVQTFLHLKRWLFFLVLFNFETNNLFGVFSIYWSPVSWQILDGCAHCCACCLIQVISILKQCLARLYFESTVTECFSGCTHSKEDRVSTESSSEGGYYAKHWKDVRRGLGWPTWGIKVEHNTFLF